MKILVLDDNAVKQNKIRNILIDIGIEEKNIEIAVDIISAKKCLNKDVFDILLLDIQIPNRFDQSVQVDGALNLLNEITSRDKYSCPSNIIGITAYDESFDKVQEFFQKHLWALLKYDETSDEWIENLKTHISHLFKANRGGGPQVPSYNYDLACICAVPIELESLKGIGEDWEFACLQNDSTIYQTFTMNSKKTTKKIRGVASVAPQMGMTAAAVLSMNMIHNFTPRYLIMPGITAGVKGRTNIGDVLVADISWDYGSGKIESQEGKSTFSLDPRPIRIDQDIRNIFERVKSDPVFLEKIRREWPGERPETILDLHVGAVASGAAVINDKEVVSQIIEQNRKLLGVEMETYGVMYAANSCWKPKPTVFSLKSVCDFANEKNDKYQKYAAYTSVQMLRYIVEEFLEF